MVKRLSKLSPSDILRFGKWWNSVHDAAYTWMLWGAAYLMNGGCSDDGSVCFRYWLILKGEPIYTAVLKAPDALSKVRVEPDEALNRISFSPSPPLEEKGLGDEEV